MEGYVKLYRKEGYGFISTNEGDRFFHVHDIVDLTEENLQQGLRVEFDTELDKPSGKMRAVNVRPLIG